MSSTILKKEELEDIFKDIKIKVLKKDSKFIEEFDPMKISRAIGLSAERINYNFNIDSYTSLLETIAEKISKHDKAISVDEIHNYVIEALKAIANPVYEQYSSYVDYKKRFNKCFAEIASSSKRIIYDGDKENANKNSSLISTKKELLSGLISKELMLEFELSPEIVKAHNEGWIYIHDMSDRLLNSFNCALADVGNILKGGFSLNGVIIKEPKTIESACSVICDIILCATSQEYGGYTIPRIDSVLAPYVRKSYIREKQFFSDLGLSGEKLESIVEETVNKKLMQGIQTLEYKINCVNNACG